MFAPLHCLNFGIGGDQTQHVLWRCMNGEMDNMSPQVSHLEVTDSESWLSDIEMIS